MRPDTGDRHPDDLALDAVRTGEASREISGHAAACAACTGRLEALRELAAELSASRTPVPVPASREAAILATAAGAASRARRRRRWTAAAIPVAAAAAALLIALLFRGDATTSGKSAGRPRVTAESGDVNRDQQVDILDAFALARAIEADAPAQPEWDFNGDRVIDALDVEWLAQLAVSVSIAIEGAPL